MSWWFAVFILKGFWLGISSLKMVKSFQTSLVLLLAVGYSVAVVKWLWWVCFLITYPVLCIHRISWSYALYWRECFLEPCTYSGVNGQWCSSGELQFHWCCYIGDLQVCVQNKVSELLKREVTGQAWIAQRAWKILSNSGQEFENVFLKQTTTVCSCSLCLHFSLIDSFSQQKPLHCNFNWANIC